MRAAVVGGVAYHAGKSVQGGRDAEAEQNAQIADLQAQQAQPQQLADLQAQQQYAAPPQQYAAPPPAAAPEAGGADMVTQLENLKKLLDEGVLTQAEFDMQKQKLLSAS